MPRHKVDLAGSVLDSLVLSGNVKADEAVVADVYDVQLGAEMSGED